MAEQGAGFAGRMAAGPGVDGLPLDQLHDEIGCPVFGGAGVNQTADVGVIEVGEDLALALEAFDDEVTADGARDELDGDAQA